MTLPYILQNSPAQKPDADKFMANYYWLFAMLKGTFIANGGMESWAAGTSFTNPANGAGLADNWTLEKGGTSGAVADVARSTAQVDTETYSLALAMGTAGSSNSYLRVKQAANSPSRFGGSTLVFGVRVKCATANKVRASVTDGTTVAYSQFHTGDGEWALLIVSLTAVSSPSELTVKLEVTADFDGDTVYADSAFLYAVEPAMTDAARATLEYFGPDQGSVLNVAIMTVASLVLVGTGVAPTPSAGKFWFDSTVPQLYFCKDGSTWSICC